MCFVNYDAWKLDNGIHENTEEDQCNMCRQEIDVMKATDIDGDNYCDWCLSSAQELLND